MGVSAADNGHAADGARRAARRALLRNVLIVFLVALAVRWAADVVLQPHLGDYVIDSYDVMGQNILDGHGFSYQAGKTIPTVTRAPFYPLWWAAQLAVVGRHFLLLRMGEGLVDAVTAALVVFMTAALCRLPWRRGPPAEDKPGSAESGAFSPLRIATITGLLYAIQPFTVYYAAKMGTETWFTFWLVVFIWAFAVWVMAPGYGRGAVMGVVLGILVLNKSTAIGLLVVLGVIALIWLRGSRALAALSLVVCVVVTGLLVTPWLIRDYEVTDGHFVAVQTLTWWNFWADFDFSPGGYRHTVENHYGPGGGHPYSLTALADVQQEARLQGQALTWMRTHPGAMLRKMANNLAEFWYLVEGTRRAQVTGAAMALELLLAAVGAWLAWRRGRHRLLLMTVVVILYFDVVYTPIKSVFHYSLVVVPFLCLLQAFVVAWVVWRVRRRPEAGEPAAGS